MGVATAIGLGLQAASTLNGGLQARRGAAANREANEQANTETREARDRAIGYQEPYIDYGQGAGGLGGLSQLAGKDYSGFLNSPDFLARTQFANDQFNNGAAAKYRLFSGGAQNDRDELNQNLAAEGLRDYRGFLQWGAGLGQQSANNAGQFGMQAAGQIGNGLRGIADAQNQRAGANAGVGFGLANIAGQGLSGMFGQQQAPAASSFGSSYTTAGSPGGMWNNYGGPYG